MAQEFYIDENGNKIPISGTVTSADMLPIEAGSSKMTSEAIGDLSSLSTTVKSSLVGAVNEVVSTKQNANVLNIVKQYTSGSSLDALQSIIAEYGKVSMIFAFGISGLGYYYGMLTFFSSTVGGGYFVNNSGRFWTIVYENGTITLTEKT